MPKLVVALSTVTHVDVIDLHDLPNAVRKELYSVASQETDDQTFLASIDQWMNASTLEWMLPAEASWLRESIVQGKKIKFISSINIDEAVRHMDSLISSGWTALVVFEDTDSGDFYQAFFTK